MAGPIHPGFARSARRTANVYGTALATPRGNIRSTEKTNPMRVSDRMNGREMGMNTGITLNHSVHVLGIHDDPLPHSRAAKPV